MQDCGCGGMNSLRNCRCRGRKVVEAGTVCVTVDVEAGTVCETGTVCVTVDVEAGTVCVTVDVEAGIVCVTVDIEAGIVCVTVDVEAGIVCVTVDVEAGIVCVTVEVEAETGAGAGPEVGAGPGVGAVDELWGVLGPAVGAMRPQVPALLIWSVSNVTAALSAMNEPLLEDPVVTVMAVRAMTFPVNFVPVPMVAELPICQNILQGRVPLITWTTDAEAVVSVEPIWKTNWAFGSPFAFSVRVPVS